jgi:hypothetical protein
MSQLQRSASFAKSYSYAQHAKVMDKRLLQQLELKCVEPLDALSKELKGFDRRSTAYFYDQR